MELLQEECLALKARLDTVQQDKAADLATYKQMLDQIRKIFQESCRCLRTIYKNRKILEPVRNSVFSLSGTNHYLPLAAVLPSRFNCNLKPAYFYDYTIQ